MVPLTASPSSITRDPCAFVLSASILYQLPGVTLTFDSKIAGPPPKSNVSTMALQWKVSIYTRNHKLEAQSLTTVT